MLMTIEGPANGKRGGNVGYSQKHKRSSPVRNATELYKAMVHVPVPSSGPNAAAGCFNAPSVGASGQRDLAAQTHVISRTKTIPQTPWVSSWYTKPVDSEPETHAYSSRSRCLWEAP
jgi:hypothetical protein